jgi:hypothetical protein
MTKAPAFQRLASARPGGLTEAQRAAIFSRIVSSSPPTVDGPWATEPWDDASNRPHWRRPGLAQAAAAAVAVGVGVTVALSSSGVVLKTAPAAAFAGWTATPTATGTSPSPTASAACITQLDYGPIFKEATTGSWVPVASDVRGPFTLGVYADAGASATCLTGPTITVVAANSIAGGDPSVASGSVQLDGGLYLSGWRVSSAATSGLGPTSLEHLSSFDQGPFSLIEGRVARGVSAVKLDLANGSAVQATVGGGWFLAWWPGSENVSSAQVTTAAGATGSPLSLVALPGPGGGCVPTTGPGTCVIGTTPSPTR